MCVLRIQLKYVLLNTWTVVIFVQVYVNPLSIDPDFGRVEAYFKKNKIVITVHFHVYNRYTYIYGVFFIAGKSDVSNPV